MIYREDAIALAQSIEDEYDARSAKVDYTSQTFSEEIQCSLANPTKETAKKWGHIADGAEKVKEALKALPTVEPEWKTRRWIFSPDDAEGICTVCQYKLYGRPYQGHYLIVPYNYCPNCGAKMEEST